MSGLRVLVLEPSGNLWGSEQVLLTTIRARAKGDAEMAVCLPPGTPLEPHVSRAGLTVYPTFVADLHLRGRMARLRAVYGLMRAARRFRPDVLHVNQAGATRIALIVGKLLSIPVTTHIQISEDVPYIEGLGRWVSRLACVFCVSDAVRAQFDPQGPVLPDRILTLYNPVDVRTMRRAEVVADPPFVTCVGRLVHTKGQDVLLEALAERTRDEALRAVFVGNTPDASGFDLELRDQAARLGIEPAVEWIGFDANPARYLSGAVASVCPSRNEPFGLVIVEAWAAGTIPIAWKGAGGAAELIEQSGGGLLFDDFTGASLAATLRRAMTLSPAERSRLVEAGQTWARAECDPVRQSARMMTVWKNVAGIGATA